MRDFEKKDEQIRFFDSGRTVREDRVKGKNEQKSCYVR